MGKKYEVEITQVYITDKYMNKETKSFKDKKEAIKYAEMMNCSYRVLFEKSPKQDQFVWEIKVKEIKPIKVFNK